MTHARSLLTPCIAIVLGFTLFAPPCPAQAADHRASKCSRVLPDTEQAVVGILKVQKARLQPHLRLVEDLGANDQRLADLTMHLEDSFLVELPEDLADGTGTTMKSYVDALHKALGCRAQ